MTRGPLRSRSLMSQVEFAGGMSRWGSRTGAVSSWLPVGQGSVPAAQSRQVYPIYWLRSEICPRSVSEILPCLGWLGKRFLFERYGFFKNSTKQSPFVNRDRVSVMKKITITKGGPRKPRLRATSNVWLSKAHVCFFFHIRVRCSEQKTEKDPTTIRR